MVKLIQLNQIKLLFMFWGIPTFQVAQVINIHD